MSRRQDREGVERCAYQRHINRQCMKLRTNENGWLVPEYVWQGWEALGVAIAYTRRALILWKHYSEYERAEVKRIVPLYLAESRACRRPKLP